MYGIISSMRLKPGEKIKTDQAEWKSHSTKRSRPDTRARITVDPEILTGKAVVKGTRLSVEFIIELLAKGWTTKDILENYPQLASEDIQACLAYAGKILRVEKVYPLRFNP